MRAVPCVPLAPLSRTLCSLKVKTVKGECYIQRKQQEREQGNVSGTGSKWKEAWQQRTTFTFACCQELGNNKSPLQIFSRRLVFPLRSNSIRQNVSSSKKAAQRQAQQAVLTHAHTNSQGHRQIPDGKRKCKTQKKASKEKERGTKNRKIKMKAKSKRTISKRSLTKSQDPFNFKLGLPNVLGARKKVKNKQ